MSVEINSIFHDHRKYVAQTDRGQVVIRDNKVIQGEEICLDILREGASSKRSMKDPLHAFLNRMKRIVKLENPEDPYIPKV